MTIQLTPDLSCDVSLLLGEQPGPVLQYVQRLLATPPVAALTVEEHCGSGLSRPLRQVWRDGAGLEVERATEYATPPTDARCMAPSRITTTLRPAAHA